MWSLAGERKIFIIAEAGVNHNGSLALAKELADKAAWAGADAVKFQTFHAQQLVCRTAAKADYQTRATDKDESQLAMLKKLELSQDAHRQLMEHCREKNIRFLSTPFDVDSLHFLARCGMDRVKIPSGEITNYPYLREVGKLGKDVILSSGMCTLDEVRAAVEVLRANGSGKVTVLHCNTEYPTPYEDVNLRAMRAMGEALGVLVGYSDHTLGIEIPIAAAALGAVVIEKHFTLDRHMEGPDHGASLEPEELRQMVTAIRHIEEAMGSPEKQPSPSERKNKAVARRSIVAAKNIQKGELFTEDNLTAKRPGSGLSPMRWEEVLGTRAIRDFVEDELIEI